MGTVHRRVPRVLRLVAPKPRFLGAVPLGNNADEMFRKGYRVFFYLVCRDDRLPNGMKLRQGSPGPRRATSRIWGKPGDVLTPDTLLTTFRATMFNAWRRDHYGRDAWWYITPPEVDNPTETLDAIRDPYAYDGEGSPRWEGMTLRLPR